MSDTGKLGSFCSALKNGNASEVEAHFNAFLLSSISIRDTFAKKDMKENYFHGILVGLLSSESSWIVKSNVESGNGYSDIPVEIPAEKIGCVIEVKYAENGTFDAKCTEALTQIEKQNYTSTLQLDGMQTIHAYGIACFRKGCRVAYKNLSI